MKKTKVIGILIVVVLVSLVILFIPGGKKEKAKEPETIKIGAILPLTGNLAYLGQREKKAIDLFLAEWNKSNQPKISLIYEDSKADPKIGVSSANKLITTDEVKAVITSLSSISMGVQPIANNHKIIQLAICMHPEIAKKGNHTLRFYVNVWQEAQKISELISSFKNLNKVGFLWINTPEIDSEVNEYIGPAIKKNGKKIVFNESYSFSTTTFNDYAVKLKASETEIIIILGFGIEYSNIFDSLYVNGLLEKKIVGGAGFLTPGETSIKLLEGVIFVAPEFDISPQDISKSEAFIKAFKSIYNEPPSYDSAYAYDGFNILVKGLVSSKDFSADIVMQNIVKIKEISGVTGKITILENGDAYTNIVYAIYRQSKIIKYSLEENN